ncbi:hypothetical protein G4B84_008903 [Aspergillus flavus NRRL3357]|nr:uncharacterized protein G4B84_008903 [Aspergillus flavus NRRL3357]QMW33472.1 hypothetical protein G4B84_008903 [Aspergillus flavus NRRL3357]QMW45510.1 hypothetical protein G4B11_008930 [Aspergillus flavus]
MRGFPAFQSGVKSDSCQWQFKFWEAGRSSVRIPVPFAQTLTVNILVRKACAQGHEIHTKGEATERSVSLVPQVVHSHGTPTETSWISWRREGSDLSRVWKGVHAQVNSMETPHQGTVNEINSLPTKKYSLRSGGSHQHSIEEDDTEETETSGPCLLPDSSLAELRWSDRHFEDIQLLLDPILFDKVEHNHALQLPSAVGVPCIDIDPADTFSFLARISSKESASLQTRYDCSSLLKRGWEGQGMSGDSIEKQGVLPFPVPASSLTDTWPSANTPRGSWPGVSDNLAAVICDPWYHGWLSSAQVPQSLRPAYEIIHQIRTLSQNSTIMHTWSQQVEGDCIRFFSPSNLQRFISIYWTAWHPHYPVIHKPTFSITSAPAHLTAAMAVMGACFSQNANDNHNVKLWLNSVEEMVFSNRYFGDLMLQDPATVNIRDIVQLLQAAYCVCTFQISEGSHISRRRIRRQRFSMVVSLARDLNLFSIKHKDLDNVRGGDFCWETFIATEECIRTMLFIYIHDTGFAIFSNYPPRTRIQEMSLGMACPEACFQAQTATECLSAIRTWTAHPLWGCRRTLRDIVKVMFCKDINLDVRAYISHLGILNLWIVCSASQKPFDSVPLHISERLLTVICAALCAEAFQINSLISVDTQLQPMRTAIHNWKLAWNQRFAIQDSFGLPKEEDTMFVGIEDHWRRLGFFQNASEYWLLLNILIRRIDERQRNRDDLSVQSDVELTSSVIDRPYTPSRCDSPTMEDLNNLISEHHRQFKPYA